MPLRILVVEDHAPFRRLICAALQRRAEFQIFEAADGLEAVQKAEALQPDLILLDINLPKLHGFEVAQADRQARPPRKTSLHEPGVLAGHRPTRVQSGRPWLHSQACAATDLMPAIDAVLAGQRFVSSSVAFAEPAEAPAPRRHEILFCPDDAAIVDGMTRFVAAALNAADAAIVLATESHRTRLLQALRAQGVDIDGAIERGTCFHSMLTKHLTPSDFLRPSTVCVRPPSKPGKHIPAWLFAGNAQDACGPQAERRRRFSSNNSVASSRTTSIFCACIRCRTRKTIRRSSACARGTPLFLPASRCNVRCV